MPRPVPAGHLLALGWVCTQPGRSGVLDPSGVGVQISFLHFHPRFVIGGAVLVPAQRELCGLCDLSAALRPRPRLVAPPARRCRQEPSLAWPLPGCDSHTAYRGSQPMKLLHIISLCTLLVETSARQLT